jgi:hypothetical protein
MDAKSIDKIVHTFLLGEQTADRLFTNDDKIEFDGIRVAFLNYSDQFPPTTSPWLVKQRDWTWALLSLCLGIGLYLAARAIGWIIGGFTGS